MYGRRVNEVEELLCSSNDNTNVNIKLNLINILILCYSMDPSPFVRTSFWTVSLGLTVSWISSMGVGQKDLQRFLSLPDLKAARK